ncbi:nuclease-like protein [Jatrophihabitans sp. GAS493]|uniref:nuclease-related domain-containing protein n=1 Tax=Jatrophihabitans sp. GAS493 TaxID=1907575 RepID=UPI000BC08025|nr:nuclease-related domain-containing protein [Jatrophihabitans sp. GAS493]SOD70473.1 nuclease-like protein [Jatrophihabitans sp. GAS493]
MSLASVHRITRPPNIKTLVLRRNTTCGCGTRMVAGEEAGWDRSAFVVRCLVCVADAEEAALDALFSDRADAPGMEQWVAEHEQRLAKRLAQHQDTLQVLDDRRILGSRTSIDHIVIGPSGVFVIVAKSYANAKIDVRRGGGLFVPVHSRLVVGSRDKTALISAMNRQVYAVRTALEQNEAFADVPVQALLCIVDGVFPWIGTIDIDDVHVRNLNATVRMVQTEGEYDAPARSQLVRQLAKHLPPTVR